MRSITDIIEPLDKIPDTEFMTRNSGKLEYIGGPQGTERLNCDRAKKYAHPNWRFSGNKADDPHFYVHNSDGFRNDVEFDTVDWDNTCAIVGCSYVYGQSIESYNTVSSILTSKYNVPTMNLGVPGSSNRRIHNNAIHVIKKYKPKKVIVLWTHTNRSTWTYGYGLNGKGMWDHSDITNAAHLSNAERKQHRAEYLTPTTYLNSDFCYNTLYDYQLYKDVHNILGTIQYDVTNSGEAGKGPLLEAEWMKPKDITYYQMRVDLETGKLKLDYNNPDHIKFIDDFYARDMYIEEKDKSPRLAHWGRSICMDVADLIYRENFT